MSLGDKVVEGCWRMVVCGKECGENQKVPLNMKLCEHLPPSGEAKAHP